MSARTGAAAERTTQTPRTATIDDGEIARRFIDERYDATFLMVIGPHP